MAQVPNSTIQKWRSLVDGIISLHSKNVLNWRLGADENEFYTSISDHVVRIRKVGWVNDLLMENEKFVITIANKNGSEIDTFDTDNISDGSRSYQYRLDELRKQILRKASGAEGELDKLLKVVAKLEDDNPF